jgi:DNA polymerase III epsilon subunit-like protein
MAYYAIDTETTGLPTTRAKPSADNIGHYDKCRLLSFALVEFDKDGKEQSAVHFYRKPEGFEVAATEIHGITTEIAESQGETFEHIYNFICSVIEMTEVCTFVGHNIQFDMNVIKSEIIRAGFDFTCLDKVREVCTLKLYKNIMFKPIKLTLLYEQLLKKPLDGAHGALPDARAAGEVYPLINIDNLLEGPAPTLNPPVRRVILKASEIAACVGLNPYKSREEVMEDIWKKVSPSNFKGMTRYDRQVKALRASPQAVGIYEEVLAKETSNSDEVQKVVKKAVDNVNTIGELTEGQKRLVADHIRHAAYTNHGTRSEDKTAELDEAVLFEDPTFYTLRVCVLGNTAYEIVGRIDRYEEKEDGKRTLVEIKNRTRGLFNKLRPYERVQVQTYLQMIGWAKEARLVEQFNDQRKSYFLEKDDLFWEGTILNPLRDFCKVLHYSMAS